MIGGNEIGKVGRLLSKPDTKPEIVLTNVVNRPVTVGEIRPPTMPSKFVTALNWLLVQFPVGPVINESTAAGLSAFTTAVGQVCIALFNTVRMAVAAVALSEFWAIHVVRLLIAAVSDGRFSTSWRDETSVVIEVKRLAVWIPPPCEN